MISKTHSHINSAVLHKEYKRKIEQFPEIREKERLFLFSFLVNFVYQRVLMVCLFILFHY